MIDLVSLSLNIDSSKAVQGKAALEGLAQAGDKAGQSADRMEREMRDAARSVQLLAEQAASMRAQIAALDFVAFARSMNAGAAGANEFATRINALNQAYDRLGENAQAGTRATGAFGTQAQEAARSTSRMSDAVEGLGAAFATVGLLVFANQIRSIVGETLELASRLTTLNTVLERVGTNLGYSAGDMQRFAENVKRMGITSLESRNAIIQLAQANVDLSLASRLARVAQDAAVIGGINSSQALQRLIYGTKSAQTEVLRTIGINVSWEQSYRQIAAELGKTASTLTEAERTQARFNAVFEAGAAIAGSYEASMSTANKALGSTQRYVEDLKIQVGQVFEPAYTQAVFAYAAALQTLERNAALVAIAIAAAVGAVSPVIIVALVANLMRLVAAFQLLGAAAAAGPWIILTGALLGVGFAMTQLIGRESEMARALRSRNDLLRENTQLVERARTATAENAQALLREALAKREATQAALQEAQQAQRTALEALPRRIPQAGLPPVTAADLDRGYREFNNQRFAISPATLETWRQMREQLAALTIDADNNERVIRRLQGIIEGTIVPTEDARKAFEQLRLQLDPAYAATQKLAEAMKVLTEAFRQGIATPEQFAQLNAVLAAQERRIGNRGVITALSEQRDLLRQTQREQFILTELRRLDMHATAEQTAEVRRLAGEVFDTRNRNRGGAGTISVAQSLQREIDLLALTERERTIAQQRQRLGAGASSAQVEEVERLAGALYDAQRAQQEVNTAQQEARALYEQTRTPIEAYAAQLERLAALRPQLDQVFGAEQADQVIGRAAEAALENLKQLESQAGRLDDVGRQLGLTFTSAFEDAIVRGRNLREVLQGIVSDLARLAVREAVTAPFLSVGKSLITGLFGGLFGPAQGGLKAAYGHAFGPHGVVHPFAAGGVVSRPTLFAFAQGTGLMGEAGEEAIMPLRRNQRGQLGVVAEMAGSGNGLVVNQHITINVQGGSDTKDPNEVRRLAAEVKRAARDAVMEVLVDQRRAGGALETVR